MYPYPILFGLNLYDIAVSIAIIFAMLLCNKLMEKRNFSFTLQKLVVAGICLSVILGFAAAILFQAFYNYLANGKFVLSTSTGMTFYGGFIGGAIVFLLVWFVGGKLFLKGKSKNEEKRKIFDMLDIAACCVPPAHAIGRIGCFFAGCCHGAETNAWYGVEMLTREGWKKVVPVQLYEALFLILLTAILLFIFFKVKFKLPLMPIYAFTYGLWRFFIEFARDDYRGNSPINFLTPSQFIAILLILISIFYFAVWFIHRKRNNEEKSVSK
jgi:phosphatidylglycerol:prolipoprotein diacylglycerol transferase